VKFLLKRNILACQKLGWSGFYTSTRHPLLCVFSREISCYSYYKI